MQMSVRLRRRVQKGEEMKKKKNGLHCVVSDQPLNFDLNSHHISYIILAKLIKLCVLEFDSKKHLQKSAEMASKVH